MSAVIPWSYSSWSGYQTCPLQFYETRILKKWKEPEPDYLKWGNEVHKGMELRISTKRALPQNMQCYEPMAKMVEAVPGKILVEVELACDYDLKPCGFWDKDAWARGKGDVVIVNGAKAVPLDWKTGKKKPNSAQLELMTALVFTKFPEVQVSYSGFVWLQDGSVTRAKYTREDESRLWEQFYEGLESMLWSEQHDTWPAKPSGLCKKHCPVLSCTHNGRR